VKKIEIKYCPLKWLKWERNVTGHYPESWKELNPRQLIAIASTYKGRISNCRFLYIMTGIKTRIIKKLDEYQQYKLFELMNFINDFKPYNSFIINKISVGNRKFYAPGPRLKGMPLGQFIFADSFFWNYQQTGNPKEMTSFLASLFLPKDQKFSEDLIEKNSRIMEEVDTVTREAVFINYLLIYEWLTDIYPLLFPQKDADQEPKEEKHNENAQRDSRAWIKVFENLVGDDIVNQDKYARLPVHNVFRYITEKIKENLRNKKKR